MLNILNQNITENIITENGKESHNRGSDEKEIFTYKIASTS